MIKHIRIFDDLVPKVPVLEIEYIVQRAFCIDGKVSWGTVTDRATKDDAQEAFCETFRNDTVPSLVNCKVFRIDWGAEVGGTYQVEIVTAEFIAWYEKLMEELESENDY